MPRGRYSLHDPHDHTPLGEEHFHCAPGPSGWRYVSQITTPTGDHRGSVDLAVDELGRPIRLELHAASWQVRAAPRRRHRVLHGPHRNPRHRGNACAPTPSPARPRRSSSRSRDSCMHPDSPETRVRLVAFTDPVLAPLTVDQSWALLRSEAHATDNGPLTVDEYQVSTLDTVNAIGSTSPATWSSPPPASN
ncbi:hypothetical protein STANM309S_00849 [Streptomyces tanashiensis]